jgi:hypothetical protein
VITDSRIFGIVRAPEHVALAPVFFTVFDTSHKLMRSAAASYRSLKWRTPHCHEIWNAGHVPVSYRHYLNVISSILWSEKKKHHIFFIHFKGETEVILVSSGRMGEEGKVIRNEMRGPRRKVDARRPEATEGRSERRRFSQRKGVTRSRYGSLRLVGRPRLKLTTGYHAANNMEE